jgi:vanadium-dependent haloperoxidase-like protein
MTARSRWNRRGLLKLGLGVAAGIASTPVLAQDYGRYRYPFGADRARTDDRRFGRRNPVQFWSNVSLQLAALDHSIDAMDVRAPGPCACARALGLAHIVIADAVAAVYPTDFQGFLVRHELPIRDDPEAFVGGAAASILEQIFDAPAHSQLIAAERSRFIDVFGASGSGAWQAGFRFGRSPAFTSRWDGHAIRRALMPTHTARPPGPRGHDVDPFNHDQGFYGVHWGRFPTLDPRFGNIASYGPPPPPDENDAEYRHDFEEVRYLGGHRPGRPTPEQVRVGLFWAYDGARLIGPPPRLYNQIVHAIADDDAMSVAEMARLLALCNLAMADAGIVAWDAKYRYDLWRPVVAIRQSAQYRHANWRPFGSPRTNPWQFAREQGVQPRRTAQMYMGAVGPGAAELGAAEPSAPRRAGHTLDYPLAAFTPNFPAYPSGHAMLGSACFTVLKRVRAERDRTRSDPDRVNPAINFISDELDGVSIDNFTNRPRPYMPQSYSSIDQMIEDNNRSRVYLGVHWHFDCERGAEAGVRIADRIYNDAYQREQYRPEIGAYRSPLRSSSRR